MQTLDVVRTFVTMTLLVVASGSLGCEPALLTPIDEDNNAAPNSANNSGSNNAGSNNVGANQNPFAGQMDAAVDGEQLYGQTACQTCHGPMGEGVAPFPALDRTAMLSDAELYDVIYNGRTGTAMSAYGDATGGPLDAEETWKIVTFVRTLEE